MDRPFRSARTAWLALAFAALVVAEAGVFLLVRDAATRTSLSNAAQVAAAALAAGILFAATRRLRREGSDAAAGWMLLGIGACLFFAGQIAFWLAELSAHAVRYPNASDPFFLAAYPVLMVGLSRLPHERLSRDERWNAALDFAILSLVTGVAVWELSLRDMMSAALAVGGTASFVSLAYTLLNLALLLVLYLRLVLIQGRGRMFVPNLLLVGAVLCLVVSDLLMGRAVVTADFASGSPIDLGWLLCAASGGLAGLYVLERDDDPGTAYGSALRATSSTALIYACIAAGAAILIWALNHHQVVDLPLLAAAAAGMVTLAGIRQVRTVRQAARLSDGLEQARADLETKVAERTAELEAAGASLRESEARFRSLFENNHATMLVIDPADGTIVDANPAAAAYYGWSREELRRRKISELNTLSPEQIAAEMQAARADRQNSFRFRHRRADGSPRDVEVFSGPVTIGGRPLLHSIIHDITESKRAEEALRESEARFRAIIEASPVPYALNDEQQTITDLNAAFVSTFGYDLEDIPTLAEWWPKAYPDADYRRWVATEWQARLDEAARAGTPFEPFEVDIRCKDGTLRTAIAGAAPLGKSFQGVHLAVLFDITDRKRAEEENRALQAQLFQSQKIESVGRLAGGVAHDFNNAVQAILLNTEMALAQTPSGTPLQRYLADIRTSAQHSADLTAQLLAFARKQTAQPRVVDLNAAVATLLPLLQRVIGEDVAIVWTPGHGLWRVRVDPTQVHQILTNLAVNARDAIAGVGQFSLATDNVTVDEVLAVAHPGLAPGDFVRLTVADDGCGMDAETLALVFEPFFTTKPVGAGTGLGLATVHGIVSQNGGAITVESAPGRGTAFAIWLPRVEVPDVPPPAARDAAAPRGGTETILLVEDEAALLRAATAILSGFGYAVLAANRPSVALRAALAHDGPIHLLLTDVVMPEMNGRVLADRLVAVRPALKRLYMSGYAGEAIGQRGVLEAEAPFLPKPFAADALARKIREVLDEQ